VVSEEEEEDDDDDDDEFIGLYCCSQCRLNSGNVCYI
jgi:hypothetical protein